MAIRVQVETPRAAGLSMPAESSLHERTLMAWPVRADLWGDDIAQARRDYATIASAVAAFEPVLMVAPPEAAADARRRCGRGVDVVELPIDDSWIRDSGPIFVTGGGRRAGVDFAFNGWGEKFEPFDHDDALPAALLEHLGAGRFKAPLVLEGGSITVDGEGTLITTEQCLLNPNRNPSLTREEIEALLGDYLGAETVIWLPHGLLEDHDTDGHVDNVAAFVEPARVLLQTAPPDDPNHERLAENAATLRAASDARGRQIEVVELDVLPTAPVRGGRGCVPYTNLYVANGATFVPVAGDDADRDEEVLGRLGSLFDGREIVPVPGRMLAEGGGGVHCITQQVPAAGAVAAGSAVAGAGPAA
jgi:agmatine deiminase